MSQDTNSIVGLFALAAVFGAFMFGFGIIVGWNLHRNAERKY